MCVCVCVCARGFFARDLVRFVVFPFPEPGPDDEIQRCTRARSKLAYICMAGIMSKELARAGARFLYAMNRSSEKTRRKRVWADLIRPRMCVGLREFRGRARA